ncbi:MAG: hypothetical protein ACQSGP_29000 [Frankia sp.]
MAPIALAAVILGPLPAANAISYCTYSQATIDDYGVVAPDIYLATGYGAVTHGIKYTDSNGFTAEPGFFSYHNATGTFSPTSGSVQVHSWTDQVTTTVPSSDGYSSRFCGWVSLNTAYGPAIYGVQYDNNAAQGRWGNYNMLSKMFYPDGSGWSPIAT